MRRMLTLSILALTMSACGDGDEGPTGPDAPPAVATVTVTPSTLDLVAGQTHQLQVALADGNGNTLTGRIVTYQSSAPDVATVSSSGLVTAVAKGSATLTATSESVSANAAAAVAWPAFEPSAATTLSGAMTFTTFTVPEGVEVTLSGETTIVSEAGMVVTGRISGDCMPLHMMGATVAVSGSISNVCAAAGAADLTIVSGSTLMLSGAELGSSGNVVLTNDTTLTDADFEPSTAPARAAGAFEVMCVLDGLIPVRGGVERARDGTDSGEQGGDGTDGGNWRLDCNGDTDIDGNADLNGGTEIDTPDAGHGGDAVDEDAQDPNKTDVKGGPGGNGGQLRIRATGNINFQGTATSPTRILLADGGAGGAAVMVATAPGGSAQAVGGDGGDSGTLDVRAAGGINIANPGGLEIVVGRGGAGGGARAQGADGADAGAAAAQNGGDGIAQAGTGGSTPLAQLRARGVTGSANIVMTGGDAGLGGQAVATAGKGGDGNEAFKDGAAGGTVLAQGGAGGSAQVTDLAGFPVGTDGSGGDASFAGAQGGFGFDGCSLTPPVAGGNGEAGGRASGFPGSPGMGAGGGAPGAASVVASTGDGGNGGNGDAPGTGGAAGADDITLPAGATRTDGGPNFRAGSDGAGCPNFVVDDSGLPADFTHFVGVTPCPQTVGTIVITNNSTSVPLSWVATTAPPLQISSGSGTVAPGASVTLTVRFDCSQATSFDRVVELVVIQANQEFPKSYLIRGNVN